MSRLKILFLTSWYPTPEKPNRGIFVREHARAVQLYNDVIVLHCAEPTVDLAAPWQLEHELDGQLTEGIITYRSCYRLSPIPKTSYVVFLRGIFQAYQHIIANGFQPDILHAHVYDAGVPAILLGKRYGLPTVITEHSSAFPRQTLSRLEILKARFAFRAANRVLPVSTALQRGIEQYGMQGHFRIVPNTVDISSFFPSNETKGTSGLKRLLFVGKLIPLKGLDHLLDALGRLRQVRTDWHLSVVGDGPQRQQYEHLAFELGLAESVTFYGYKPKPEVAVLMRQSDLFILASLLETFSAAAIEALASGIPVLATRCGGPEDFVSAEVGRLVPPGDSGAIYLALDEMLNNLTNFTPTRLADYAAKRFSYERVGAQLDSIYAEL